MAQVLTARGSVLAERIVALLVPKIGDAGFYSPTIKGVSYGDQNRVPESPWVCVEPSDMPRQWPPSPSDQTELEPEVNIYVYHVNTVGGETATRKETDKLAETISEFLNINHRRMQNASGDDLVVYSYVVRIEYGKAFKDGTMYKAASLTWRAKSKLPLTVAQ